MLLAFDILALAKVLGRKISFGKIIHGDNHASLKVKTDSFKRATEKAIDKVAHLLSAESPPELILNRHCVECEFQQHCRQKAIEKDELSLLARLTDKERRKFRDKGIFTITQLSCTFRPRRRPKRMKEKHEKYHHALKALAIRENKIHVVGNPQS
jgi:predicted RecB family nuclease